MKKAPAWLLQLYGPTGEETVCVDDKGTVLPSILTRFRPDCIMFAPSRQHLLSLKVAGNEGDEETEVLLFAWRDGSVKLVREPTRVAQARTWGWMTSQDWFVVEPHGLHGSRLLLAGVESEPRSIEFESQCLGAWQTRKTTFAALAYKDDLLVVDALRPRRPSLFEGLSAESVAASPSGRYLAVRGERESELVLHVLDLQAGHTVMTSGTSFDQFVWSPREDRLVFVPLELGKGRRIEIWSANAEPSWVPMRADMIEREYMVFSWNANGAEVGTCGCWVAKWGRLVLGDGRLELVDVPVGYDGIVHILSV